MTGFGVSFDRELRALMATPLVWGAAAAVSIPAGLGFAFGGLVGGSVADLARAIGISTWCVGAAACALAARSVPAERRAGTWDLALASPMDVATVLHAKFAAIAAASGVLVIPIALQALALATVASPSWSVIACGALGLWLLAAAAAGVGLLAGVMVRSNAGAIVAALIAIAAWIALCRGGQSLNWTPLASASFALDPIRRAEDFTRGSFDLGSGLCLLIMGAGSAWCAGAWARSDTERPANSRELLRFVACAGAFVAVLCAALALRGPGAPVMRVEAATMFSGALQPATRKLISESPAPMQVTLWTTKGNSDPAALRNGRSILARAAHATLADGAPVQCRELDSLELADAEQSAAMFESLEASETRNSGAWREATDKGLDALRSIESFADSSSAQIQTLIGGLPKGDPLRSRLEGFAAALDKTASAGSDVRAAIAQLATPTVEHPLGNAEAAGRKLANELKWWSVTLQEVSDFARDRLATGAAPMNAARQLQRNCANQAEQAKAAQDRIDQLPPLRLSEVAAAMQYPPTLIVGGARGVAAVPAWQMKSNVDAAELALAEAIRCAAGAPRIAVTVVHAQAKSPLEGASSGADLSLLVESLRAARMEVNEWNPAKGSRPPSQGAKRVWVVIPPLDRSAQEPDPAENALLEAARRLLAEGESVLVTATPNPFAAMGISDPWADILQFAGVRARSGRVVLDLGARSENTNELRSFIEFPGSDSGHPAALSALNESILWPMPVPLEIGERETWKAAPVEWIPPAAQRWIENDPRVVSKTIAAAPAGKMFAEGVPVLVAAQRDDGARVAMAGGLSWMLTQNCGIGDGERRTLRYPGNRDLAVAIIRWLAGSEPVATMADTGRVPALADRTRIALGSFALVMIPLGLAFSGRAIWKSRRSR